MKKRHRRGLFIIVSIVLLAGACYFVIDALNSNISFYFSPTEVKEGKAPSNKSFRIGGMVKNGSIIRNDLEVNFIITDFNNEISAKYVGSLPDLFKENSGVVAQGRINNKIFIATEVLAKHDENYTPPPVQHILKKEK